MKYSIFCLAFVLSVLGSKAQVLEVDENILNSTLWKQVSFTFKTGTPSLAFDDLGRDRQNLINMGISELGASYKINSRVSVGVSFMGGLGNCLEGFFDNEGNFIEIDDDDGEDADEEGDDEDDVEECESEVESLMATLSYLLSDRVPFFIQGSIGYNIDEGAPAYSIFLGYNQPLFAELSITGGVRFSEVLINLPPEFANYNRSGIKAEIGLNWNF